MTKEYRTSYYRRKRTDSTYITLDRQESLGVFCFGKGRGESSVVSD